MAKSQSAGSLTDSTLENQITENNESDALLVVKLRLDYTLRVRLHEGRMESLVASFEPNRRGCA